MYNQEELKTRYSGISASFFNWFDISPYYAKQKLDRKIEEPPTKEQELGIKLHAYLLEKEEFKKRYVIENFVKPMGSNQKEFCELCSTTKITNPTFKALDIAVPCYKTVYNTDKKSEEKIQKEALLLYEKLYNYINFLNVKDNYRGSISYSEMKYLKEAKQVVLNHETANQLLFNDTYELFGLDDLLMENELKIYWEYPEIEIDGKPLVLKSIIDRLVVDFKEKIINLIDIKTSKYLYEFGNKFIEHKYDRQMALYWKAVKYYLTKTYPDINFSEYKKITTIIAIQTPNQYRILPVECKVITIDKDVINSVKSKLKEQLKEVSWHLETNKWNHNRSYYENDGVDLIITK